MMITVRWVKFMLKQKRKRQNQTPLKGNLQDTRGLDASESNSWTGNDSMQARAFQHGHTPSKRHKIVLKNPPVVSFVFKKRKHWSYFLVTCGGWPFGPRFWPGCGGVRYLRWVRGCMRVWWAGATVALGCFGLLTLVLLLANSRRIVWGKSGSNRTPCCRQRPSPKTKKEKTIEVKWWSI